MQTRLRVLYLEDAPTDAELVQTELAEGGIVADLKRVASEIGFETGLADFGPDVILADYRVPGFDGLAALAMRNKQAPHIPFIFVTGSLGEERAVAALQAGATDYILKDRMARLPVAVSRAMEEKTREQEKNQIAAELEAERQMLKVVLSTAKALITVLNDSCHILHLNTAAEEMLGLTRENVSGATFWEVFSNADGAELVRKQLRVALEWSGPMPSRTWRTTTPSGRTVLWSGNALSSPGSQGERLVLCGLDVTDQELAEQKAYVLGHFDSVTGLPNRALFTQRLEQRCQALPEGNLLATMMVGLSRVKEIRDSYGETVLNQVLAEAAQRLRVWQSGSELLARIADDNFVLAFEPGNESTLAILVSYILEQLREPIEVEGKQVFLGARGGVALYPRDGQNPEALLQGAEAALHCAEGENEHNYAFYTPLLSDEARERLQMEGEFHAALQRQEELMLLYQPQVSVASGQVMGFEALLRWQHPRLGMLTPARFITMVEVCGLMPQLGRWVLRTAAQQMSAWQDAKLSPPPVSVNLSASQFSDSQLMPYIEAILSEYNIAPSQLELELTESATMRDPQSAITIMSQLHGMGVRIAIDDFGTGYSNLSYLKRFPVDRLKLDQAFVRELTADPNDLAISRAVIAMAQQLKLEVVAEGVETPGQLALLAKAQCDTIQGYFFSPPVTGEACHQMITDGFVVPLYQPKSYQRTLLLVDDEPNVLASVRRVLWGAGYRLLTSSDAGEAFELLATNAIGVIMADQRMPRLNGTQFLNRVKTMHPDTVRIVLTSHTDLTSVTEAISEGAIYKYLTKPWDDNELQLALNDAFECYERSLRQRSR
jgi:diguanylate cyclase (GGDEF)-like protein/PAS domain S-box-containing protein